MLHVFLFSAIVLLIVDLQNNPFSPSHSASESQSFQFSVKIISRSPLAGARKSIFTI